MKTLQIADQKLFQLRSLKCKTQDKFNRIYKIAAMGKPLMAKMDSFISTVTSERAQSALAVKTCLYTGIRIGNEDSAEGYYTKPHPHQKDQTVKFRQTFGLTTLRKEHVKFVAGYCRFEFVGKKGVEQVIIIRDKKLVKQLKSQYNNVDGDTLFSINDVQVRKFVRKSIGKNFLVKDLRTLFANMVATDMSLALQQKPKPQKKSQVKLEIKQIVETTANMLGNTPGICKRSYIDPLLLEHHIEQRWS